MNGGNKLRSSDDSRTPEPELNEETESCVEALFEIIF